MGQIIKTWTSLIFQNFEKYLKECPLFFWIYIYTSNIYTKQICLNEQSNVKDWIGLL